MRLNRRELLRTAGVGAGWVGLQSLLQADNPLGPKAPQFPARAKRVIWLFLNGGPSQVDTFDPKPALDRYHGQPAPSGNLKTERKTGNLMKSPFRFHKHGQSGLEISEIFPQLARHADDLCVIRSMHADRPNHEPSLFLWNCGHNLPGRPSLGSWLTYGLGTENQNLPGYVVLCPGLPVVGHQLWSSTFLPAVHQGTYLDTTDPDPRNLIANIRNGSQTVEAQRQELDLLAALNKRHLKRVGPDPDLEAAIESSEIAFRMQAEAPEAFDITREPAAVRARYGEGAFARGCLMARRLAERGVRMVQVYFGNFQPWDNHDDIQLHRSLAQLSDGPIAALLDDLKASGMFKDTLVIIGGEFGRTPAVEVGGLIRVQNGRDHNNHGFSYVLAGGGVKGGLAYGATDEFGFRAVENRVHIHDLQATILHLMGLDHTRLTYRYSGRDFRLTDVEGEVVKGILA